MIKELSEMFKNKMQWDFGKENILLITIHTYNYVIGFGSKAELSTPYYDAIAIACYDWSKKLPYFDYLDYQSGLKNLINGYID